MRVFTAMGAAVFVRCVFAGSGGVDGSLCCPNCPPGPCGKSRTALTPLSDDNIQDAVRAWCDDPASAAKVYGDIASWDTGAVTNMTYLFGTTADGGTCATFATFNEDVSRWNTSRVTSMYKTFYFARTFDGDVSSWDTSNVTTMRDMFRNASSFSGDLSSWDTSRVIDIGSMFGGAASFNSDISSWNVSRVENLHGMFHDNPLFNRDLTSWDVSRVTDMAEIFIHATSFDQHLCWDVPRRANTTSIFEDSAGACINETCGSARNSSLYC